MGNPNTVEEKKSKIETKKQEIKESPEENVESNNNIYQNSEEIGIGGEIGESGKLVLRFQIRHWKTKEKGK